jgi:hypothetical protein
MRREEAVSVGFPFFSSVWWLASLFISLLLGGFGDWTFFRGRGTYFLLFMWVWCVVGYAA